MFIQMLQGDRAVDVPFQNVKNLGVSSLLCDINSFLWVGNVTFYITFKVIEYLGLDRLSFVMTFQDTMSFGKIVPG